MTNNDLVRLKLTARANLRQLGENPYPGRGIVVGLDETGEHLVQVYWIMGRSENSRNRVFGTGESGLVFTEAANPAKVKDPSLIIYNAMREVFHGGITHVVVSNGSQTDDVAEGYSKGWGLSSSLSECVYEPDKPNFTPRITASCYWAAGFPIAKMSILRKSPWDAECDRHFFEFNGFGKGFGRCITTYLGDGDPLPAFQGEPLLLPLYGNILAVANTFWEALNFDNRVSLVVKFIPKHGPSGVHIINKFSKT